MKIDFEISLPLKSHLAHHYKIKHLDSSSPIKLKHGSLSKHAIENNRIYNDDEDNEALDVNDTNINTLEDGSKDKEVEIKGIFDKFKCDICQKLWKSQEQLDNHKLYHADENRFQCEVCFKKCKSQEQLDLHKQYQKHNFKGVTCEICGETNYKG